MSVLLAAAGVGPFVQQTAVALQSRGLLQRLCTTFALVEGTTLARLARGRPASRVLPATLQTLTKMRPLPEIVRVVLSKFDQTRVLADRAWDAVTHDFDRWCARQVDAETRAVYGYDYNCEALFAAARDRGIARILELPCAEHDHNTALLALGTSGGPTDRYARHVAAMRERRTARRRRELELATLIIVNSAFSRRTYEAAGLDTSRFRIVPLGAPPTRASPALLVRDDTLRLAFGGDFGVMKGARVLLDAVAALDASEQRQVRVDVFGTLALPGVTCGELPAGISVHGRVPRAEFLDRLAAMDALVLPSLSDGFGMVVTEALAQGVPVLVSDCVGAAELVDTGRSGIVFRAGDAVALRDALRWCLAHRDALRDMRSAALANAAERPWSAYRDEIASVVADHLRHGC